MNEYFTVRELAEEWNLTVRRVQGLCNDGLLKGAVKNGKRWMIPKDAVRPDDHRTKAFKTASGK